MSYLQSLLNSIGKPSQQAEPPPVSAPKSKPADNNAQAQLGKRKAEEELRRVPEKAVRIVPKQSASLVSNRSNIAKARPSPLPTFSAASSSPVRDASKPDPSSAVAASSKAPKKGSFAEIMARTKQVQKGDSQPAVAGRISHKPNDVKLSNKKEIKLQKELAKRKKTDGPGRKPASAPESKRSSPGFAAVTLDGKLLKHRGNNDRHQETARPKAQVTSTYKGTARTAPSSMKPTQSTAKKPILSHDYSRSNPTSRSHSYEDDDDDEGSSGGSEDGQNDQSDDYADMDAGFDEVEEEDERAAREAKKEDYFEEMRLKELARQKEARKRRALEEAAREKKARAEAGR